MTITYEYFPCSVTKNYHTYCLEEKPSTTKPQNWSVRIFSSAETTLKTNHPSPPASLSQITCDVVFTEQLPVFVVDLPGVVCRQVVDLEADGLHRLFGRLRDLRLTLTLQVLQTLLLVWADTELQQTRGPGNSLCKSDICRLNWHKQYWKPKKRQIRNIKIN